jgi:hypothetical protein
MTTLLLNGERFRNRIRRTEQPWDEPGHDGKEEKLILSRITMKAD